MRNLRSRPASFVLRTLVVTFLAASAGCNNGTTTPTPVLETENLTGTLQPLGSDQKRFTVNYQLAATDASVTVTALTTTANGTPLTTTIGVAFGAPAFDGSCATTAQFTDNAAPIGQERVAQGVFVGPQVYCVKIFDAGTLTEATDYAITLKHF